MSPWITRTASSRAPSSSATTWASVVSCPCPWHASPKLAVTVPPGSTRIVAPSVPVLMAAPGEAEIAEPTPVSST